MHECYKPDEKINWFSLPTNYPFNMKNREKYKWWKPIVVGIVGLVIFFACFYLLQFINVQLHTLLNISFEGEGSSDISDPIGFTLNLAMLAAIIPSFWIAMKICGMGGIGTLSSITGKFRWERVRSFAPWLILFVLVIIILELLIDIVFKGPETAIGTVRFLPLTALGVLIFAPLQCAGEEYFFRGYLMQTFSSWIPIIIIPVILQMIGFGLMHTQYSVLGWIETGLLGLTCAYVTIKTGGLEGAICIHAANNTVSMFLCCFISGLMPSSETTVLAFILNGLLLNIGYAVVTLWIAKRKGYILK